MDKNYQRKIVSVLKILVRCRKAPWGTRIAQRLEEYGFDLSQRMVRNYLQRMDQEGLTKNLGKRGRSITPKGEEELKSAFVIEKVGFVASKIDSLTYQMSFSLRKRKGGKLSLISLPSVNMTFTGQFTTLSWYFGQDWAMGRFVALNVPVEDRGAGEEERVAIGTVCSVTINGIFLSEGIHSTSRFGGLLELVKGHPFRFTDIINYDGSSIDPLEIFVKGGMTSVVSGCAYRQR